MQNSAHKQASLFTDDAAASAGDRHDSGPETRVFQDLILDEAIWAVNRAEDHETIDSLYENLTANLPQNSKANSARTADFNRDGYLDLVLRTSGDLLYGQVNGFDEAHRYTFELPAQASHVSVADWNDDGWIDVQFSLDKANQVLIFWNSPLGFDSQRQLILPAKTPGAVETADLKRDGNRLY